MYWLCLACLSIRERVCVDDLYCIGQAPEKAKKKNFSNDAIHLRLSENLNNMMTSQDCLFDRKFVRP